MKNVILVSFLVLIGIHSLAQQTDIKFLSGTDAANTVEWDFYCTDGRNSGKWSKIPVPSNWELQGFGTYNYGHDEERGKEHGLYKYEFEVPQDWKGKTVNVVFDGSMTDTRVKINGKSAGEMHQGAFYRFKYDISKLLKYGNTNLLEVDVAKHSSNESVNRAERLADFWIFGGIFRPVYLEAMPAVHMKRIAIDAKADGSFRSFIELNQSKADYSVTVDLFDLKGNNIGISVSKSVSKGETETWVEGQFDGIKSWNPEWPALYDIKISLNRNGQVIHELTERIGFRTVELREHDGFYINGEKVVFKGVNRHSFWPETGRALSEENHLQDIRLMKEMNMNAVRSSHYVPDKRFLELCDSLGLFVLNEVTGWQDGYDTIVGPKLVKETVLKDENHPSVVIWNHGNEGGWNFANEKGFHQYDIQKRPVLYPWLLKNGADTFHYPEFNQGIGRNVFGNDPFMPTELLHGLYDGGHGAGLEAFWRSYEASPLLAGGFLWVLCDEAVLRTDKEGTVYDSDGNHAPDGILGPHREKEGSFYTIKEIWSPVQVEPVTINKQWNGRLFLKNKFIYTHLNDCAFSWRAYKTEVGTTKKRLTGSGVVTNADAEPGETVRVTVDYGDALQEADIFEFTALNHEGSELYTWSWPVVQPKEIAQRSIIGDNTGQVSVEETDTNVRATANGIEVVFNKKDGTIQSVKNANGLVSLNGGPVPVGVETEVVETNWENSLDGHFQFVINYSKYPGQAVWKLHENGLLELEVQHISYMIGKYGGIRNIDYIGISFNYPEEKVEGITWMGQGPYRVWKNRTKGHNLGVWQKAITTP
ncbi:glycoside hydrolase family 2 protein [Geofilum rubicundum]|uniref:beta-galactosidase n=1 Tax=Geofilum rubicundum JCM 15548 TaxID=1236989 RepID=A0A0E9LXR4_9BACT|nr:glycoside hydrolase family 2 [Geofilum rubicundum]GAO29665.1 beta-galactosidase [Geofilum rubicundum JCM 15548]